MSNLIASQHKEKSALYKKRDQLKQRHRSGNNLIRGYQSAILARWPILWPIKFFIRLIEYKACRYVTISLALIVHKTKKVIAVREFCKRFGYGHESILNSITWRHDGKALSDICHLKCCGNSLEVR